MAARLFADCCSLCDISNKVFILGQIESVAELKLVAAAAGHAIPQAAAEEHGDTSSMFPIAFPAGGINSIQFSQLAGAAKLQLNCRSRWLKNGGPGWTVLL